ncbi:hypothetical protein K502DRAFT_329960 [Neoconidiobolus thromboides FSU 785]|nr:hypothetical protein K502DRAFT_329960 [Neoconidiobolus thromboides FSU 785]
MANYSGPYKVSCRDIEYNFNSSSNTQQDNVLLKLYYPSESNTMYNQLMNWACFPDHRYLRSLFDYIKMPHLISSTLIYLLAGQPKTGSYISDGSDLLKDIDEFPVALFSHGLAGTRTFYSGICGEIASHGIIVAAVEHRDGSAAYSYKSSEPRELEYQRAPGEDGSSENLQFRQKQILTRKKEVKDGLKILEMLNQGELKKESLHLPDKNDKEFLHLKDLNKDKEEKDFWFNGLNVFKNKLKMEETYLIGHSFGGATVLDLLTEKENPYKLAVTFDPWMYPVTNDTITKPSLGIVTEAFYKWQMNYDKTLKIFQTNNENQLFIQLNTLHYHQSDVPSLVENVVTKFKTLPIFPKQALRDNANAALKFIEVHMDPILKQKLKFNIPEDLNDKSKFTPMNIKE